MFQKDSRTENFLTQMGVEWKYTNRVTFDQLAHNWRTTNLGRPKAKVDEAILEYAVLMEQGSAAPAPILWRFEDELQVLDGVQRLFAAEQISCTQFSAYIIKTDSDLLARAIRVFSNARLSGNHAPSMETNIKQAVSMLVIESKMSVEEVARFGGWPKRSVEEEFEWQETGFHIRCIGGPTSLKKYVARVVRKHARVDDLKAHPDLCSEFVSIVNASLTNGETEQYVERFFDIDHKKSLRKQLEKNLGDFKSDPEIVTRLNGRKRTRLDPDVKLRAALLAALTTAEKVAKSSVVIHYVEEFYRITNQIKSAIADIKTK